MGKGKRALFFVKRLGAPAVLQEDGQGWARGRERDREREGETVRGREGEVGRGASTGEG